MMERLEPVMKQKFWILLGVAIIMTFVGWWMSTAALAKTISDRKSAIEKAFKSVPTGTIPNEDWTKKLSDINAEQERAIARTQAGLWKRQLAKMMTWPDGVDLRNGYWGLLSNNSKEAIRLTYRDEVERVWREVNPLDYTGKGIVSFPMENMYAILKQQPWNNVGDVTSETMWEIKEDLWLLERLFQSIDSVNGGPDVTRNDAAIHVISDLQLRGGGAKDQSGEAAPAMGGGGLAGDEIEFMRSMGKGGMGGMGGRTGMPATSAGGQPTMLTPISAEFDPAEEFGNDGSGGSTFASRQAGMGLPGGAGGGMFGGGPFGGGGGGNAGGNRRERGDDELAGGGMGGAGGLGGVGGMVAPAIVRYISKEENKPFKTRGFYLSVTMDHTKIPDLIAELTSCEGSDLPVEIVRVQMARLHEDEISQQANMSRGMPGRPGMARGGMRDDDDERPRGLGGNRGGMGGGGGNSPLLARAAGALPGQMRSLGQPGFPGQAGIPGSVTDFDPAYASAEASLNKALADPVMAQVTICGIFTLYQKATEPVEETPAATPPAATDEAVPGDSAATTTEEPIPGAPGQPDASGAEAPPVASESAEAEVPMEPENEASANSDATATKPDDVKLEEDK